FAAEAVQVRARLLGGAVDNLGLDLHLLARDFRERGAHIGMGTVGVGAIEEGDAGIEGVPDQPYERRGAEPGLPRLAVPAGGAGAHPHSGGHDAVVAERDGVVEAEVDAVWHTSSFSGKRLHGLWVAQSVKSKT